MATQKKNEITGAVTTIEDVSGAEFEAHRTALQNDEAAVEAAKVQKEADKASAKAKLIAGEALTEAEADAILI